MNEEVTYRIADESDLDRFMAVWTSALNPDPSVFTSEFYSCPSDRRWTFVAEVESKVVSTVQLFGLPVRDEEFRPVMVGAVANVATLPEFRLKGISTHLLGQAADLMVANGFGWSFLFTGVVPYYERLGWRSIHRSFLCVHLNHESLSRDSGDVSECPIHDIDKLRALSEASYPTPLSQIRTKLDWRYKIPPRLQERSVFMGESCFAIVREGEEDGVIEEWGMPEPSVESYQHLLVAIARWADEKGIGSLVVKAPIVAEARQPLEALFSRVEDVDEGGAMVRPLSPEWPMSRLISLFALPEARFFRLDNF